MDSVEVRLFIFPLAVELKGDDVHFATLCRPKPAGEACSPCRGNEQPPAGSAGQQTPNSNLQTPKKHEAPGSKTDLRAVGRGICFRVGCLRFGTSLELGIWSLVFRSASLRLFVCQSRPI